MSKVYIENQENLITIQYFIEKMKDIKIFGNTFVKNNKNKCSIIIDGTELELCSNVNLEKIPKNKNN